MSSSLVSSFSNQLVEEWSNQLSNNNLKTIQLNERTVFEDNARTALSHFSVFKGEYETIIKNYFYSKITAPEGANADDLIKKRRELWITEQINLALDLFWEPLARVAEQLKSAPYEKFFANDSQLEKAINGFKVNAKNLFGERDAEHLLGNVLVYFDKTTRINRYPYTNIALIGIPYRVFNQFIEPPDERKTWMSIVHELGHHIYWNMAKYSDLASQKKKFEDAVFAKQATTMAKEVQNLIRPWMGEIFVDTIGLQISGTNNKEKQDYIDTCKELILRKTDDDRGNLSLDDGDHVPDGLRLLVPLAALDFNNAIEEWKKFLKNEVGKNVDIKEEDILLNRRNEDGDLQSDLIRANHSDPKFNVPRQICNTVKIILDEVAKFKNGKESLFKIASSSTPATAQELLEIAKKLGQTDTDRLFFALHPEILEGEQAGSQHTHPVNYGKGNERNAKHTHTSTGLTLTHTH